MEAMVKYQNFTNENNFEDTKDISPENSIKMSSEPSVMYSSDSITVDISGMPSSEAIIIENAAKNKLRRFIEHLVFRVVCLVLILADIIILIVDLTQNPNNINPIYEYIGVVFVSLFVLETILRIIALGPKVFFLSWFNVIDLLVISVSFVISVLSISVAPDLPTFAKLIIMGRLVRLVVLIRLYTQHINLKKGARQFISQNKRRYQEDGFDLDLTYVTDHVIAMSFPSSGKMSLYRNSIREVSKFLEYKHQGHYKVYNLCSEKTYDTSYFDHRVERFIIDDHNVPLVNDMVSFVENVERWLSQDPKNVIAVHCKGGKGRTGTMICVWLIHTGLFGSAEASLSYFGNRRTDLAVGHKFQGVETPSQNRYVEYFTVIKEKYNGIPPHPVPIRIQKVVLHGSSCLGRFKGGDLTCQIFQARDLVLECDFALHRNCQVSYHKEDDKLEIKIFNCPVVAGDVKFRFNSSTKHLPVGYEKCNFYFWFHSSFLADNTIRIERKDLDNPHKSKTWKVYKESFAVEVFTEPAAAEI